MNGQDRSHPLASSSTGTNGAPSGAVNSQSWLRDMVADPVRAAQAGIINPRQDTGQNSIPTLSQFDIPSSRPYGLAFQMLQNAYNVNGGQLNHMYPPGIQSSGDHPVAAPSAATYSAAAEGGQQRLPLTAATVTTDTLSVRPVFTQPSSTKSSVSNEYGPDMPAKRLKPSADDTSASSSLPPTATHPHSSTPPIPHRPDYFHKGSVIQLSEQKLKRIEDLHTSDFETSASISSNLSLDCSTVTKIVEDKRRGTAFLTFSVGDRHRRQSVEATVEATVEHPFFVYDQGWSSVSPEKSLSYYKIYCKKLNVQDRCISLTFKDNMSLTASSKGANVGVPNSNNSHK